jgi:hypothetical protein
LEIRTTLESALSEWEYPGFHMYLLAYGQKSYSVLGRRFSPPVISDVESGLIESVFVDSVTELAWKVE